MAIIHYEPVKQHISHPTIYNVYFHRVNLSLTGIRRKETKTYYQLTRVTNHAKHFNICYPIQSSQKLCEHYDFHFTEEGAEAQKRCVIKLASGMG